jgi:hypothetical protein
VTHLGGGGGRGLHLSSYQLIISCFCQLAVLCSLCDELCPSILFHATESTQRILLNVFTFSWEVNVCKPLGGGGDDGGAVSCAIDVVVTGSLVKPCHSLIGQRVLINGVARARLADRPMPGRA